MTNLQDAITRAGIRLWDDEWQIIDSLASLKLDCSARVVAIACRNIGKIRLVGQSYNIPDLNMTLLGRPIIPLHTPRHQHTT